MLLGWIQKVAQLSVLNPVMGNTVFRLIDFFVVLLQA